MSNFPVDNFETGEQLEFADHLNSEFDAVGQAVEDLATSVAEGNEALHGPGKETGACGLSVGTGLSALEATGHYWVGGVRVEVTSPQTIVLPANQVSYVYQDADQEFQLFTSLQSPRPAGYWFLGTATADGTTCTAVDDSDADTVAGISTLADRVTAVEGDITDIEVELADHESRITVVETNGGGGGGPVYANPIPRSSTDPTTIGQKFDAIDAELDALESGSGGGNTVVVPPPYWDIDSISQALALIDDPDLATTAPGQINAIIVKWGVWGDGSNGSPDYIDRVNSTWLPS